MVSYVCWVLAAVALCGSLVGCGDNGGETVDSEHIVRDRTKKNERRLAELERRVARLRRERREHGGAGAGGGSRDGLVGFDSLANDLNGEVGAAVGPPGSAVAVNGGGLTTGSAWSTIKVAVALRVLQAAGGPDGLKSGQRGQIERAITASDTSAADHLFRDLGSRHGGVSGAASAVTEVLRQAGDDTTVVSTKGRAGFSPYGQTKWSLRAQQLFMSALAGGCIVDPASGRYLLDLMGRINSDRWGLGSAGLPARWKGGWGPETDGRYLVRQMGVLDVEGKQLVVSIAARPSDGQFASGQAMATRVAKWLAEHATRFAGSPVRC